MAPRRTIIEVPPVNLVLEPEPEPAPECGATLTITAATPLRPVPHSLYRCLPARHPKVFELRCGRCARIVIVRRTSVGLSLAPGDQKSLLRAIQRLDREVLDD